MPVPRKRFAQHFLQDGMIIEGIIQALAPQPEDHLIEIGPGQGALTFPLLKKINQLEVIELDRDLIPILKKKSAQQKNHLEIYHHDVLDFDFSSLKTDERLLRIVGNLPYNISTPLIFHLLQFAFIISDMLFMVQKEVAERLVAKTNTRAYGRLSVMVQYYCSTELLFHVPPTAFYPPPKVESSIIRLRPYQTLPFQVANDHLFARLVKQAFNQRRKTLRNSLKEMIRKEELDDLGIASHLRAENLSVEEFVKIANAIDDNTGIE